MFKRHAEVDIAERTRQHSLQVIAGGRRRFIWRDQVPQSLIVGLVVTLGLALLGDSAHPFSMQRLVLIGSVTVPLFMLGGYLTGKWRWTELEKKYHE